MKLSGVVASETPKITTGRWLQRPLERRVRREDGRRDMGHTPLKPCPLCGREPELLEHEDGLAQNGTWTIECFECQLELTTAFIMEGNPGADKRKMLTLAVRRWNRRKSA